MSANDSKIKEMLNLVNSKRDKLGERPKPHYESNGLIDLKDGSKPVNINTLTDLVSCVEVSVKVLNTVHGYQKAIDYLGLNDETIDFNKNKLDKWLVDLKVRSSILKWEIENKKLKALESQLKDLRSEDAKTEDALDSISKLLG